ncbi:MAG: oligosaccharide flippase family protein [Candidatus Zambryskibacteria bacterium]|nr:oligosaccharide flippase family protein [Candidatus Zambryskibacteria bacterium]
MQNLRNKTSNLLHQSENFLKTDTTYLAKGGFWLSLGQGVAMLSGFLISLAFANLFPKESFGNYKFILSVASILGIFTFTGLNTSIIQSTARGFGGSLRQGFRINLKWSIGIFLGGLALGIYYYINGNILLSFSFLLAGILLPITASAGLYGAYLMGKKDFKRSTFYGMARNIVPAVALIATLIISPSLPVIIAVYFVIGALVPLFLYYKTLRAYKHENKEEDPGIVLYSGHLSAMDIIGNFAHYLDKILIFHYLGAVPLAIYAFAIAPVEQLQSGKKILSTLILPKISGRSFEELQESGPRKALLLTIYALGLAFLWVILAPYFYRLLFPQYLDSVFYSQIYAFTLLAISGTIFNETLIAHKKKKELYLHRTIVPIVQIVLFFILLPLYGLMGLVVTHVIMRSFSGLLGYYFVKHPLGN